MGSILKDETITKIKPLRSILLRSAIWIFISGVVLSVIIILISGELWEEYVWKLLGTLFILALALVISINNFKRIESKKPDVQILALLGLVTNIIWAFCHFSNKP